MGNRNNLKIALFNVESGGFKNYTYQGTTPDRIKLLKLAVGKLDADVVALVDTFRWKELYSEKQLAEMFGFPFAFHINMNCDFVDRNIGLAILSRVPLQNSRVVRISSRNAISTQIEFAGHTINIFLVYLHHASEEIRLQQTQALLKLAPKKNTILVGDFNSVPAENSEGLKKHLEAYMENNSKIQKAVDFESYIKPRYLDYTKGKVVKEINKRGFVRAKNGKAHSSFNSRASLEKPSPWFEVDHIFHSPDLKASEFKTLTSDVFEKASDHYPISAKFN